MKLSLLWMYHDVNDLNGDKGNIKVLQKRCADRDIQLIVDTCNVKEEKVIKNYDLLYIGGGADQRSVVLEDLLTRKKDIEEAMENGTFTILVGGGYQFFGTSYMDRDKNKIEALGIFDYYTEYEEKRCTGNIVVEANLDEEMYRLVGFENHGGYTKNVTTPLSKVLFGNGNTYQSSFEGFYNGNVFATYMQGPLFPKNPELVDFIIRKGLKASYGDVELVKLDDTFELKAKEMIIKRVGL